MCVDDTIDTVLLPMVVKMEKVCAVRGKSRVNRTNDDTIMLRCKRDMTIPRYDPLFCVCSTMFLLTRMKIGTDRGAAVVLKEIVHNQLVNALTTNPPCCPPDKLAMGDKFDYDLCTCWFNNQVGDMVTAHDNVTGAEINISVSLYSNII